MNQDGTERVPPEQVEEAEAGRRQAEEEGEEEEEGAMRTTWIPIALVRARGREATAREIGLRIAQEAGAIREARAEARRRDEVGVVVVEAGGEARATRAMTEAGAGVQAEEGRKSCRR